uniref:ER lumen protein-retaining receptor n=1 Tax=Helicotheca tamesis TaxID=374047 RepID=A0A7S2IH19_9STRA
MSLSIYQLLGDLSLAASFLVLIYQLAIKHEAGGISRKTQELYLAVFMLRYINIFGMHPTAYSAFIKFFCITASLWIISVLRFPIGQLRYTTNPDQDGCNHWLFVVIPSLIFTLLTEAIAPLEKFRLIEFCFTYSLFLESMALIPQLFIMHFQRNNVWETDMYVFFVGLYRCMYVANGIFRSPFDENHQRVVTVHICGFMQWLIILAAWFIRRCHKERSQTEGGDFLHQGNNSLYNLLEEHDEENAENRALIPSFMLDDEGEPIVHSSPSPRGSVHHV